MITPSQYSLNEYSTPCISDALDSFGINGGLEGIVPLNRGMKITGPAYTLDYQLVTPNEEGVAGEFMDEVEPGSVIVIANNGFISCTVWGDILSFVAKKKGILGTVIDGCCRDIEEITKINYPIFSKSVYMKSGKNRVKLVSKKLPIFIGNTCIHPGDIICGDDSGVISIPKNRLDDILKRAKEISIMEETLITDIENGLQLTEARIKNNYNKFSLKINKSE